MIKTQIPKLSSDGEISLPFCPWNLGEVGGWNLLTGEPNSPQSTCMEGIKECFCQGGVTVLALKYIYQCKICRQQLWSVRSANPYFVTISQNNLGAGRNVSILLE